MVSFVSSHAGSLHRDAEGRGSRVGTLSRPEGFAPLVRPGSADETVQRSNDHAAMCGLRNVANPLSQPRARSNDLLLPLMPLSLSSDDLRVAVERLDATVVAR